MGEDKEKQGGNGGKRGKMGENGGKSQGKIAPNSSFKFKDKMCKPHTGYKEGLLCAVCTVNAQHRDDTTSRMTTFTWKVVHV